MTRIQRQSEGFKKGNGQTHDQAVENVVKFIETDRTNIDVYKEWYEQFNSKFCQKNGLRQDYGHSYDIAVKIGRGIKTLFIEIDGEKHSKTNQKINDGIAEKYAKEELGFTTIRLPKRELIGDKEDVQIYLMQHLWRYLK